MSARSRVASARAICISNVSTNVFTAAIVPNYVVNWFVPSLQISTGPGAGQVTLTWTGTGYTLQTNSSLTNPGGWGTVPGATLRQ